jgi:hypothetical protein
MTTWQVEKAAMAGLPLPTPQMKALTLTSTLPHFHTSLTPTLLGILRIGKSSGRAVSVLAVPPVKPSTITAALAAATLQPLTSPQRAPSNWINPQLYRHCLTRVSETCELCGGVRPMCLCFTQKKTDIVAPTELQKLERGFLPAHP